MYAEYILAEVNPNVILCNRGIPPFETATPNTLDLSCIPVIKQEFHLPIIIHPDHETGHWNLAADETLGFIACGVAP